MWVLLHSAFCRNGYEMEEACFLNTQHKKVWVGRAAASGFGDQMALRLRPAATGAAPQGRGQGLPWTWLGCGSLLPTWGSSWWWTCTPVPYGTTNTSSKLLWVSCYGFSARITNFSEYYGFLQNFKLSPDAVLYSTHFFSSTVHWVSTMFWMAPWFSCLWVSFSKNNWEEHCRDFFSLTFTGAALLFLSLYLSHYIELLCT